MKDLFRSPFVTLGRTETNYVESPQARIRQTTEQSSTWNKFGHVHSASSATQHNVYPQSTRSRSADQTASTNVRTYTKVRKDIFAKQQNIFYPVISQQIRSLDCYKNIDKSIVQTTRLFTLAFSSNLYRFVISFL